MKLLKILPFFIVFNVMADDEQDLLANLVQTTSLATKTKLNVDHVPGIITVLKGSMLREYGARNVADALNLVPGVSFNSGEVFSSRGISAFSSGKVKLMVNDIPFNDNITSVSSSVFNMPIELVDRIEMIRGPASTVYGEYAFNGVINVITVRQKDTAAVVYGPSMYGLSGSTFIDVKDWKINLNVGRVSEDSSIMSGPDALPSAISNAPGPDNTVLKADTVILNATNNTTTFDVQHMYIGAGDGFGMLNFLPPYHRVVDEQTTTIIGVTDERVTDHGTLKNKVVYSTFSFSKDNVMLAPAFAMLPFDMQTSFGTIEQHLHTESSVVKKFDDHELLIGVGHDNLKLVDTYTKANFDQVTFAKIPMSVLDKKYQWILDDQAQRKVYNLTVQDQIKFDKLTLTTGLRIDNYSDVGNFYSPRISAVCVIDPYNVVKSQVSSAFRPPTLLEMYSNNLVIHNNSDIGGENIRTAELSFIHKGGLSYNINTFVSELSDMITLETSGGQQYYANNVDAKIYGIELESTYKHGDILFDFGATAIKTVDLATNGPLAGAQNWSASIGARYVDEHVFGIHTKIVGPTNRDTTDVRQPIASYTLTDVVYSKKFGGFTVYGTIHNLFDTKYVEYAGQNTYVNDYPTESRHGFVRLAYEF